MSGREFGVKGLECQRRLRSCSSTLNPVLHTDDGMAGADASS